MITGNITAVSKYFLSQGKKSHCFPHVHWIGHLTKEAHRLGSLRICKWPLCKSTLTAATYLLGLEMVSWSSWSITFPGPVVPWVLFPAILEDRSEFCFPWSLHTSPSCHALSAMESGFARPAASSFSTHRNIPSGSAHVTYPVCVP